jgi:hypothetical protein
MKIPFPGMAFEIGWGGIYLASEPELEEPELPLEAVESDLPAVDVPAAESVFAAVACAPPPLDE